MLKLKKKLLLNSKLWMVAPIKVLIFISIFLNLLGDIIPIRLYLGAYDLTPSLSNVSGKFSVKYFLNLVLLDEDDRRYFKRQEIQIWRRK